MADREARKEAAEWLNGLGLQYAGRDPDLAARIAEFASFVAHGVKYPDLLAEPIPDLMERRIRAEHAREAGQRGRGKARPRKASASAREVALQQWEKWLSYPDEFTWESYAETVEQLAADLAGGEGIRNRRQLARWCMSFVEQGHISAGWIEKCRQDGVPSDLLRAIEMTR